jgi:hypothetical protein
MWRLASNLWSYRIRGLAFGAVLTMVATIAVGLCFAAARDEQPFRRGKLVPSDSIDAAVNIGLPIATPIGVFAGFALAEWVWRRRTSRCT